MPNAGNIKIYTSGDDSTYITVIGYRIMDGQKIKTSVEKTAYYHLLMDQRDLHSIMLCIIGSKKQVLKCLSNIIIVIAAANTGRDIINSMDVIKRDHTNNGKPIDE
jgi:hypothetical protein